MDATEMDLDKGEVLLKHERPERLIFFSRYIDYDRKPRILLEGEALDLGTSPQSHEVFSKQVANLIVHYRAKLNDTVKNPEESIADGISADFGAINDLLHQYPVRISSMDSSRDKEGNFSFFHGSGVRPKPFEICRPTLLIFGTGHRDIKFSDPFIEPRAPETTLDPHCSNIRLWDDNSIMGWYSSFAYNQENPQVSTYFYNLVTKQEAHETHWPAYFDPGNGNGGGPPWPP